MGQNLAVLLRGHSRQYILEVVIQVVNIEPGVLDQAHAGSSALARAHRDSTKSPLPRPRAFRKREWTPLVCQVLNSCQLGRARLHPYIQTFGVAMLVANGLCSSREVFLPMNYLYNQTDPQPPAHFPAALLSRPPRGEGGGGGRGWGCLTDIELGFSLAVHSCG